MLRRKTMWKRSWQGMENRFGGVAVIESMFSIPGEPAVPRGQVHGPVSVPFSALGRLIVSLVASFMLWLDARFRP